MSQLRPFHHALPVDDLQAAERFYGTVLGLSRGRSDTRWIDWDCYGHQLVTHLAETVSKPAGTNHVDDHEVPIPHFGVVLDSAEFQRLAERLRQAQVEFVIEPYLRFAGQPGEQWTMFFLDPAGNALEFKGMDDLSQLFAS